MRGLLAIGAIFSGLYGSWTVLRYLLAIILLTHKNKSLSNLQGVASASIQILLCIITFILCVYYGLKERHKKS